MTPDFDSKDFNSITVFQHARSTKLKRGPSRKSESSDNITEGSQQRPSADNAVVHCYEALTSCSPTPLRNQRPGYAFIQHVKVSP